MERPGKIVCVGKNYVDHAAEMGSRPPAEPLIFLKPPSAVIWHDQPIVLPRLSHRVDHEAEIGVILARTIKRADEAEAFAAIAGVTCVNDVTARDLQKSDAQWTRGKGFDTFCPVGPVVVPSNEVDVDSLEVTCRVNGALRQQGHARDMVFGIGVILSYISQVMTLEPGDLVATGTPAGVGPLQSGDVVEVEVSGVGVLRNPVVAESK